MANQGLTPEQFEILFGDVIRREIEMLAAQESEHGATHLEGSTEVFDIASAQTSVIPAQPAPAQIDTSAPIPTDHEVEASSVDQSQILVGPLPSGEPKKSRRWLSGLLVAVAMVAGIGLIGFFAFQRQADTVATEVLPETETSTEQDDELAARDASDPVDVDSAASDGSDSGNDESEASDNDDAGALDEIPEAGVANAGNETEAAQAEPDDADDTASNTPESSTTSTTTPEVATTEVVPETTLPAAAAAGSLVGAIPGSSVCQDPAGDAVVMLDIPEPVIGAPGAVDLIEVELTISATQVVVRWRSAGEVPENLGEAGVSPVEIGSYSATLWSDDPSIVSPEEPIRRVNLIADVDFRGVVAVATGTGPSFDDGPRSGEIAFDGDSIVATFPIGDLGEFPAEFNWTSLVRVGLVDDPAAPANFATSSDSACPSFDMGGQRFPS